MSPFKTPVTNVRIYPYIPDAPIRVLPVFVDGVGTYSFGTLTTNIFYNVDLSSGVTENGGSHAGLKYYAVCKGADSKDFTTVWMTCLTGGAKPSFGRTISHDQEALQTTNTADSPEIAYQIHLADISVDMYLSPIEPMIVPLIEGGGGIATFAGLLPGGTWSVSVSGGTRLNHLSDGMRVTIRGTNIATGKPFTVPAVLTTKDARDPAVFVQRRS